MEDADDPMRTLSFHDQQVALESIAESYLGVLPDLDELE